jgi:hypothetical protein
MIEAIREPPNGRSDLRASRRQKWQERVSLRAPTCRGVAISVKETVVDIVMQGFGISGFSSLTGED